MKSIQVWPQVFAADLLAEYADAVPELTSLAEAMSEKEETVGPRRDLDLAEWIALALTTPPLQEGTTLDWLEPYLDADPGGPCLEAVMRLRVRNDPGFALVHELREWELDNHWLCDRGQFRRPRPPSSARVALPAVYTLGLSVEPPTDATAPNLWTRADGATAARRPYASAPEAYPEVERLATHLAPRVQNTFGGAVRLAEQPVLAPICAAAASVWLAMQERPMRKRSRKTKYTLEGLARCVQALDLAEHEATMIRIIVRNHVEHIPIDVSSAPARFALPAWHGRLAVFALDDEGAVHPVAPDRFYCPPALFSLVQPEPL